MHALSRHVSMCSRRGLGLLKAGPSSSSSSSSSSSVVLEDICSPSASRNYSSKVTSSPKLIKEEREKLVIDFVEKYKASNKGQLPGISLVRKEVGGSYNILKEIMQDLEQKFTAAMAPKEDRKDPKKAQLKDTLGLAVVNTVDATSLEKRKSVLKEKDVGSVVFKAVDPEAVEGRKPNHEALKEDAAKADVFPAVSLKKDIEIGKGHKIKLGAVVANQKNVSQLDSKTTGTDVSIMEELLSEESGWSEDEDDDSDLAAPEYDRSKWPISSEQTSEPVPQTSGTSVVVNNVPNNTSPRELREALADCGEILNAGVFPTPGISKKRGAYFGVVTFKDKTGFEKAQLKKEVVVKDAVVQLVQALPKEQESKKRILSGTLSTSNKEKVHKIQGSIKQSPVIAKGSEQAPVHSSDKPVKARVQLTQPQYYPRPSNPFAVRVKELPLNVGIPEIKDVMGYYGEVENLLHVRGSVTGTFIVWFKSDIAAANALRDRQVKVGDQWYPIVRQSIPWTPVVRISNLPDDVTASKLRSTCEKFASVAGLEVRKGNIADVQFDVKDFVILNSIVERLNRAGLGKIKITQAPRFFCGENPESGFQPPKVHHARQVRDTLLNQLEQQIKQLSSHLHDCCELVAMKQDACPGGYTTL